MMERRLIPLDVYKEAMDESLKNAVALIQASIAVANDASKVHGLLLSGLASEEIAKAYACLLVASKLIPRNHPLIEYQNKKSVFRNHDVKNELMTTMGATLLLAGYKKTKPGESFIPDRGEMFGMGLVANYMGSESTKIRSDRMYVDIRKNKTRKFEVLSPMKMETDGFVLDHKLSEIMIAQILHLYELFTTEEFQQDIEKHRAKLRQFDTQSPTNPEW